MTAPWRVEIKGPTMRVTSGDLSVDFRQSTAWTISRICYRKQQLVGPHGSQGTVITWGKKFVGTGHGGEVVHRFVIRSDGREYEPKEGEATTITGREISVVKESTIGPFRCVAKTIFPKEGEFILSRYRYKVEKPLDNLGRIYVFMHCVENQFKDYLAVLPDSTVLAERVDKDDGKFVLKRDVKAVVYYSRSSQLGMAFVYPEVYKGATSSKDFISNMIWDRKTDNKLYFNAAVKDHKVGDEFEYHLKFTPFVAGPEEWKSLGKGLAEETGF